MVWVVPVAMETHGGWIAFAGVAATGLLIGGLFLSQQERLEPRPALTAIPSGGIPDDSEMGVYPGDIAPDFSLSGLDMREVRLSDYRGHNVLLNFFTSWCEPCRLEIPACRPNTKNTASTAGWSWALILWSLLPTCWCSEMNLA